MAVTVYRSDDAGAPQMQGLAGDTGFIAVLDACLVTGYGSKAPAGWAKPFSGTAKAVYRAAAGTRCYLQVDETSAQYPVLRGYREMTAIDTGVGPFPTTTQLAGGIRPVKSSTTTAINRPWILVAGSRAFYLWISFAVTDIGAPSTSTDITFFGDLVSYLPGDTLGCALIGKEAANTTSGNTRFGSNLSASGAEALGHYLASGYLLDGNSAACCCLQSTPANNISLGSAGAAYPDPITGGLLLDRVRVCEGGSAGNLVRGRLPGLYNPLHNQPGNHLDTLGGRGTLSGQTLLLLYKGGTAGRLALSLDESDWLPPA